MKKQKTIMKKSLALYLIKQGHELKKCEPNNRKYGFYVYKFIETPELITDMLKFNANR